MTAILSSAGSDGGLLGPFADRVRSSKQAGDPAARQAPDSSQRSDSSLQSTSGSVTDDMVSSGLANGDARSDRLTTEPSTPGDDHSSPREEQEQQPPRPTSADSSPVQDEPVAVDINPIFKVRQQLERMGGPEAHLDSTCSGDLVLKKGPAPSSSWVPWRSTTPTATDEDRSAAADVTPTSPSTPKQNGAAGGAEAAGPSEITSSKRDSVRMKLFSSFVPETVPLPQHLDRPEHGQDDIATILGTRPRSPGHSTRSPSLENDAPLPGGRRGTDASRTVDAADAAARGADAQHLDEGASAPEAQTPGPVASSSAANSRVIPSGAHLTPPRHVDRSASSAGSPSAGRGRRATAAGMQRHATAIELDGASSSRAMAPSPSLGPRTKSFDPSWSHSVGRRSEAQEPNPPKRSGSGDEFEDQIARKADVMRKERLTRRQEAESEAEDKKGGEKEDKGKRRISGAMSELAKGDVLVGNLIGEGHANFVLMYNMLTGIRIGVSRCQAKVKRPLTDEDYTARHKFSFDITGNELTPSAKYDFKFKDYAPWVFRELREYFHLDPADYLLSLTAKYILSELGSPGKSGSFFYFSRDYRFIIKTIHHSEHKFLRKILKQYHEHVKRNPHTLLSRFYGLHRVKLPRGRKIHFVIMNNLFPPHRDIHETYDLKGSSQGREYPEDKAAVKPGAVLKDLNWVRRGRVIDVGPEKRALFEEQLRRDTELLQRLGIMDYSLLIGFHNVTRGNKDKLRDDQLRVFQPDQVKVRRPTQVKRDRENAASALRKAVQRSDPKALSDKNRLPDKDRSERKHFIFYQDEGGFQATDDVDEPLPMIYYLGIIDILTPYGSIKRLEHCWKGMSHDKHQISAVPPIEYGNRFLAFLFSIVRGGDTSTRPRGLEAPPLAEKRSPEVPATVPPDSALRKEGDPEKPTSGHDAAPTPAPARDPEKVEAGTAS